MQMKQDVPDGYKLTEVGVIPEDWEVESLESLGSGAVPPIKAGPFGSSLTKNIYVPKGYKVYGQEQVIRGDCTYGDYYISESKYRELSSCSVKPGDILLSLVGTAGKLLIINEKSEPGVINPRLLRFSFDHKKINSDFFKFLFEAGVVQNLLARSAQGGTMAVLNAGMLRVLEIPLPNLSEQAVIANTLIDTDTLITSLEKLIAKKRAIKTATMQQLLTGKKRLPPFDKSHTGYKQTELGEIPEDWEIWTLEEISAFITKGSTPTTYGFKWEKEGVPFLRSECVSKNGLDLSQSMFISSLANKTLRRSEVKPDDILITITGNVGRVIYLDNNFGEANINQHIARIRVTSDKACSQFVFHFLSQPNVRSYFNTITTGQAYPQISLSQVRGAVVPMPPLLEQQYIADALSVMDSELKLLDQRMCKAKKLKQSMMQELLTGKTRLVAGTA